jgi:hypothetical protein
LAFDDTLTLDDASGDATTYVRVAPVNGEASRRINTATTLAEPGYLVIKHQVTGSKGAQTDRHLISATQTKLSSAGDPKNAVVNLSLSADRDSVITAAMIQDLLSVIIDLISDGGFGDSGMAGSTNFGKVMRGEA